MFGSGLVTLERTRRALSNGCKSHPGILDVAVTEAVPFGTYGVGLATARLPGRPDDVALNQLKFGVHAARVLGMRLVAGRFLSDNRAQDQFDTDNGGQTKRE